MIAPEAGMYLLLEGCQGVDATKFAIGIGGISLSDSVKLVKAAMFYETTATSTAFGAEVELSVKLEEWVGFYGSFYLKQVGLVFLIGMKFKTMGVIPNAFGVSSFNLFDLYLSGEIGVTPSVPPVPVVNKITVGGGICLGSAQDCRELIAKAAPANRVYYLGTRSMEFIETEENSKLDEGLQAFEKEQARDSSRLQQMLTISSPNAVAAKVYAGFEASSGRAFFYASISEALLSTVVSAVMGSSVAKMLPDFLAQASIQGFDYDACKNGTASACWSYFSFCAVPVTIDIRPPLVIQPGMGLSTSLKIFDTVMGIKLRLSPTELDFAVVAPPITLFGGQLKIWESKTNKNSGPKFAMKTNSLTGEFFSKFKGYAKIGDIAEGGLESTITATHMQLNATDLSIFGGVLKGNVLVSVQSSPPQLEELSVDLDLSKLSSVVQDLAQKLAKPLIDAKNQVTPIVEKLRNSLRHAKEQLQSKQSDVHRKNKQCDDKRQHLEQKQKQKNKECDKIKKRCWKVGFKKHCEPKSVVDANKKTCKAKVHIQFKGEEAKLSVSYKVLEVARKALQVASHGLKDMEKQFSAVEQLYLQIADKVQEIVDMVSDVHLVKLKAKLEGGISSAKATLNLEAKIKLKVEMYSFEVTLIELVKDLMLMARKLVDQMFKQVTDAAQKTVTDLAKKISSKEEMELRRKSLEESLA